MFQVRLEQENYIFPFFSSHNRVRIFSLLVTTIGSVCPLPVRQKEGTDVRDGWGCRPKLCQRHDVLEGDVRLRAYVHHTHLLWCAAVVMCNSSHASGGGSPDNLDNNGVSPDGFSHCLIMLDLGEVAPVHLEEADSRQSLITI